MKLFFCSIFFSSLVSACPAESVLPSDAVQALYKNSEVLQYICVENLNCSADEFMKGLEVKEVNLSSIPRERRRALLVEPVKKGRQFFSAVFLVKDGESRMVFSPDTTLSGLKILPISKNRLYILRGTERESNEAWKETDYGFDRQSQQYKQVATRCFRENDGKSIQVKCG